MDSRIKIDLISDTVTRPTPDMLEAMFKAEVGDDIFQEDPTVKKLEELAAGIFGKEAGLFCTSGTLANQLALNISTSPQDEVICDKLSHIYYYEAAAPAFLSGISLRMIEGDRGRLKPSDILDNLNPDSIHQPPTRLVSLENTHNKGGGSVYPKGRIKELSEVARSKGLGVHLDGARIFNALAVSGETPVEIGSCFDTISVCLSKGLGAPVGSVLLSTEEKIKKARRVRKAFGGAMRQAGYLAAAGIYALENHISRLEEDHKRAKAIGASMEKCAYVKHVLPVETNIVVMELLEEISVADFLEYLISNGIRAIQFGKHSIRMVTHLHITDGDIKEVCAVFEAFDSAG
ncbi:MAG: threonine aldolase family protein [Bacteroidota bacterium]